MQLSGARTAPVARHGQLAQAAGLLFAAHGLHGNGLASPFPPSEFKFLGINFHSTITMADAAGPARTQPAQAGTQQHPRPLR